MSGQIVLKLYEYDSTSTLPKKESIDPHVIIDNLQIYSNVDIPLSSAMMKHFKIMKFQSI